MTDRRDAVWKSPELVKRFLTGVRAAMPLAAEQIDVMMRLVRATGRPVKRFLDMGCGDGILSAAVLNEYPSATGVLLDFSDPMLDAAREKLAPYGGDPRFANADFGDPKWVDAIRGYAPFDAIVSALSIHHQTDERKQALYREILELLSPGGLFVNVEHVASPSEWVEALWWNRFHDSLWEMQTAQGSTLTKEEVGAKFFSQEARAANILTPVETQCAWLRRIGFSDVDCFFKIFEAAVFGGRRPQDGE